MFDYAYCGNYKAKLLNLAELSPEKWSFGLSNDFGILKNYLDHTFNKIVEEGKLLETSEYSIFNTGLFNVFYQHIFCYFTKNTTNGKQKWFLDGFLTEYQLSNAGINNFPTRANYFDDTSALVFDTNLKIMPQYDHIFGDAENINRLPPTVKDSGIRVQIFDGALNKAMKMLEANYKTAVPQYYNGKIQLLTPISLVEENKPDLALVCSKTDDNSKYLGHTCLTLDMAYNNARLIAKPESNWLQP